MYNTCGGFVAHMSGGETKTQLLFEKCDGNELVCIENPLRQAVRMARI